MLQTSLKTCTITNNKKSNRQISSRETNHIQMASQFHFSCCTDPIDNWSGTALKQRNVQFTIQTKSSKSGLGPIENQQPHANRWFSSHLPPVVSHLDGNVNNGIILHLESRLNCSFFPSSHKGTSGGLEIGFQRLLLTEMARSLHPSTTFSLHPPPVFLHPSGNERWRNRKVPS